MINIPQFSFAFGSHHVFDHVSLTLPSNGLIALTGNNGIGKTTLLRILGGVYRSNLQLDTTINPIYLDINFLSLEMLTVDELLKLLKSQGKHIDDKCLWESVLISQQMRNTTIEHLSLGQRQRLVIAVASALQNTQLILLDEPFNGLDQQGVCDAHAILKEKAQNTVIMFATHSEDDILRYANVEINIRQSDVIVMRNPVSHADSESQ